MAIGVRVHKVDTGIAIFPPIVVQVTELVDSYMIWVGVDDVGGTAEDAVARGRLAKDWACAMPHGGGTSLFRSGDSDSALGMAQRLARRFGKQIFLAVDVGGEGRLTVEAEKCIVRILKCDPTVAS